jgi:hypothetical protein
LNWSNTDKGKFWLNLFLATWPSFAASEIVVSGVAGKVIDPRVLPWALGLAIGNALYQGGVAVRALYTNPNKENVNG